MSQTSQTRLSVVPPLPADLSAQQVLTAEARAEHAIRADRIAFASSVDGLLLEIRQFCNDLGDEIGKITRDEAYRRLCRRFLDLIQERLALRTIENVLLRQLVTEAHDALTNQGSTVDLRDWAKAAAPYLEK